MTSGRALPDVWVGVLGPLVLHVDGVPVQVPGVRRRVLLALLALAGGRPIGVDRLVDELWPDGPPSDPGQALQNHVSRLRTHLGQHSGRLIRRGAGYALELPPDGLDAAVARALAGGLGRAPLATRLDQASRALDLWRGQALEEFGGHPSLEADAVSLAELRVRLLDGFVDARIDSGDPSAIADARTLVATDPLREAGVLLLMRALASGGRPAEAMEVAARYRAALADETGLDPGPTLGRLEQQIASGTLAAEPPTTGRTRAVLARPSTPLVGRQQDEDEVLRLIARRRVVTLTGPGGVGKTRLALDVAATLAERDDVDVVVVDLAAVDEASRVPQAVASAVGLRLVASEPSVDDVAAALRTSALLLVLDNAEHVAEVCRDLVDAVDLHAPGVRVLLTSRTTLRARSEYVVRLQPLPTPHGTGDLDTFRRQPSVRAFLEHVHRQDRSFELTEADVGTLVEVLERLDGLPLAIELVASQAAVLPLAAVRDRLGLDLATPAAGPDERRQRTLRLTIASSYERLSEPQQALLRALAAFPGGVDLATLEHLAADVVPGLDPVQLLHGLLDSSLLDLDPTRTRYRLLFTVRTFLGDEVDRLEERTASRDRFLAWAVRTAFEIGTDLHGAAEAQGDRRLRADLDNLRAARDLAHAAGLVDVRIDLTLALDVASMLRDLREVSSWCLELAQAPESAGHPREVEILGAGAEAARVGGDYAQATALATRGLEVARSTGRDDAAAARCWSALAAVAHYGGSFASAARDWERAGRAAHDGTSALLASAALAAGYAGDHPRARALLGEARSRLTTSGPSSQRAFIAYVEGELAATDDPATALTSYATAIEEARSVGATFVAGVAGVALASARARTGDPAAAAQGFVDLIDLWRRSGHGPQLWTTARNAADLLLAEGRPHEAALLLVYAEAVPQAAAVGPDIARHSGRRFVPVDDVVDAETLAQVRAEAARLSTGEVLDVVRSALLAVAREG